MKCPTCGQEIKEKEVKPRTKARYFFFDTETCGLPKNYKLPYTALDNWPRMIQIAWMIANQDGVEETAAEYLIKPNGFTIPPEASKIHNITTEMALDEGVELHNVLTTMSALLKECDYIVGHNVSFDMNIVGAEFVRMNLQMTSIPTLDTMKSSTEYCKLPGPYGYKWPKLFELHTKLFNKGFEGAHGALADVRACARCFFEMQRLEIF